MGGQWTGVEIGDAGMLQSYRSTGERFCFWLSRLFLSVGTVLGMTTALTVVSTTFDVRIARAQWKPTKPITFIVMAGRGGGADKAVRFIAKTMQERNLVDVAIKPTNITGGSGAKAMTALKRRAGDDHAIMFTLNSFDTTPIRKPELAIDIGTWAIRRKARVGSPYVLAHFGQETIPRYRQERTCVSRPEAAKDNRTKPARSEPTKTHQHTHS